MHLQEWQFYPSFHLGWTRSKYDYNDSWWWETYVFIGPLQLRFWGKIHKKTTETV